jgi:hypothetical protein
MPARESGAQCGSRLTTTWAGGRRLPPLRHWCADDNFPNLKPHNHHTMSPQHDRDRCGPRRSCLVSMVPRFDGAIQRIAPSASRCTDRRPPADAGPETLIFDPTVRSLHHFTMTTSHHCRLRRVNEGPDLDCNAAMVC